MAKEDFCFTYYDGDAARDTTHMNRLERGAYHDLVISQRKFGHLTLDQIKKVLGRDFEECWPAIELIMQRDQDGKFFIEWLDTSITKMRKQSTKQRNNVTKRYQQSTKNLPTDYQEATNSLPNNKMVIPLGNGNGDGNGNGNGDDKDTTKIVVESTRSPAFQSAWQEWKEYRKEIKKPYRSRKTELAQLHKLASYSDEEAIKMIEQSIRQGWQGIFPVVPERNNNQHPNPGKI